MPTLQAELVNPCNLWSAPLPELPQNMRAIDPQEPSSSSRPSRTRARTSTTSPRADERMADGARKRLPPDRSWEDGAA
eukprot:9500473-Pyramimonas_sp.AAC.1